MATSEKQIAANRRNATKATGPRTRAGKAVSRGNAVKHGGLSKVVVADGEDAAAFETLHSGLRSQLQPQTPLEGQLVEKLAIAFWRNRRLAKAEKILIASQQAGLSGISFGTSPREFMMANGVPRLGDLMLLGRYQVMVTNEIQRTLAMLRLEQKLREQTIDAKPSSSGD